MTFLLNVFNGDGTRKNTMVNVTTEAPTAQYIYILLAIPSNAIASVCVCVLNSRRHVLWSTATYIATTSPFAANALWGPLNTCVFKMIVFYLYRRCLVRCGCYMVMILCEKYVVVWSETTKPLELSIWLCVCVWDGSWWYCGDVETFHRAVTLIHVRNSECICGGYATYL